MPQSTIIAYEANPKLYELISKELLNVKKITCKNIAVSSETGIIEVKVFNKARGTCSILDRMNIPDQVDNSTEEKYYVPSRSLADEIALLSGSIGLWIDVEGSGFDVLRTLNREHLAIIDCIHIELEHERKWLNQKLADETIGFLADHGHVLITREVFSNGSGNYLFVREEIARPTKSLFKLLNLILRPL